jgi:hypothetical protein
MYSLVAISLCFVLGASDALVIYTRWGRTVCPTGANALYKGYMGSAPYNLQGGASNFLCMHETPEVLAGNVAGIQGYSAHIYGVEYELYSSEYRVNGKPFKWDNNNNAQLHNQDAPCVVCEVPNKSAQIVIPARLDCSPGMTLEYKGVLVAMKDNYAGKTQFICVDEAPEVIPGGSANTNGGLIVLAQVFCGGTLPCPPYVKGNEVGCAVCSI